MKKLLLVCLGALLFWSVSRGEPVRLAAEAFNVADRVGELNERHFFLFSTSAGNYIIRHDGMGEFSPPRGKRRVFMLNVGPRGRIDSVYFLEHQRDLFLVYRVQQMSYVARIAQTNSKPRWLTSVDSGDVEAPVIDGDVIIVKDTTIDKVNGQRRQD
jgi:hypothetical protein